MEIWHLTADAPREPTRVSAGEEVRLRIGTWPIEPGQFVRVTYEIVVRDGARAEGEVDAEWRFNEGPNSYWEASLGPFADGDRVVYHVRAQSGSMEVLGPSTALSIGPKLYLALLWHQHQPIYKDASIPTAEGSYLQPWVRLHALRDYYAMAHIAAHHDVHLTVNLSGSLLWQLKDYLEAGATDRALELTRKPAETLTAEERQYVLGNFFDAHWHNQIAIHPRYGELFVKRRERKRFNDQDVRDLQMWFNLAWFGMEFRVEDVRLVTGESVSVRPFVRKGSGFDVKDVDAMLEEPRSGRWGYDVREPHVLCQAYRASASGDSVTVFFRETRLSNAIGFDYQSYGD